MFTEGLRTPALARAVRLRSSRTRCRPQCWLGAVLAISRMLMVVAVTAFTPATVGFSSRMSAKAGSSSISVETYSRMPITFPASSS